MAALNSTKTAQIKFFETVGVLVVFLILLGFGLIFYNNISQSANEAALERLQQEQSIVVAQKALLLPELDCSTLGIVDINCIDILKATVFSTSAKETIQSRAEYFTTLKSSTITIRSLWPTNDTTLTIYDNKPDEYSSTILFQTPILLRYPLQNQYAFGLMEVTTYG